ncbi:MAG: UbiA-like protein EboC [Williamsia sp.]|nr:UbiA-like protein EboC [Williamsia sp.]
MRPANIITSIADVLAGVAVAGYFTRSLSFNLTPVLLLCFSTACLYAGGIVFNDVFDVETDRIERPERILPSGQITVAGAALLGSLLLMAGIVSAAVCSLVSGAIALAIALAALLYDKWGKHHPWLGPLNMGVCRGLNLLLGLSIVTSALAQWGLIAFVPVIYIYSITMISRGEVSGGERKPLYVAMVLYLIVILSIAVLSYGKQQFLITILLLLVFGFMIFRPLIKAIGHPAGINIMRAVKAGVISLIIMDAAWATAFNALWAAAIICILLPLSFWLSRYFAVT